MTLKKRLFCCFLLFAVPLFTQKTGYLRTTIRNGNGLSEPYCTPWVDSGSTEGTTWASTNNYVTISPNEKFQTVMGWGGTIQEKHWESMKLLSAAGQDSIMRQLFDTSGCNIDYLRLPIGCCDFDLNEAPISLNETKDDYEMKNFSLKRDSLRKIPLIKKAQAINSKIRFWGCPWSPPRWMHDDGNFDRGNMKSDAKTLTAYALYLEKYVLGYKDAGINVDWICCQNEPNIVDGGYPKCGWSNTLELNFYKNYMIPLFKNDNIATKIILGVFCCETYEKWIKFFMDDPVMKENVAVTSHSYQEPGWGLRSYNEYPGVPFLQSEAPFVYWNTEVTPQNWDRGIDLFNNVADFMSNRTAIYTLWNMVNDETAKSGFNWPQTVAIQVNRTTKKVSYNPWFWAYKHFGNYVKGGAKVIKHTATGAIPAKAVAFQNPNGDIIYIQHNRSDNPFQLTLKVDNMMWKKTLPPNSFNTIRLAIGTTDIQERKVQNIPSPTLSNVRISNSTLHFNLPSAKNTQEINITLSDLQGRTVWTGIREGNAISSELQTFKVNSKQHNLVPGTYTLSVQLKNKAGKVSTIEDKVKVIQ